LGFHTLCLDYQVVVGTVGGVIDVEHAGLGVIVIGMVPAVVDDFHIVGGAVGVVVPGVQVDFLGQLISLFVDQSAIIGAAHIVEVGSVQLQTGELGEHFTGLVELVLAILGHQLGGLALLDVYHLVAHGHVRDQVVLIGGGVDVVPIDVHGTSDAVEGHVQSAVALRQLQALLRGGHGEVEHAGEAVAGVLVHIDEALGIVLGVVLVLPHG